MRPWHFVLFSLIYITALPQNKFNLDFEDAKPSELPKDWFKWGEYSLTTDSTTFHSGKSSVKIKDDKGNSFGSVAYRIPSKYSGKEITLEGYMKLENVSGGHAGLLMRLDGNGGVLQFDNMRSRGISGTMDWQRYEITLPYDPDTKTIYVAGILQGKGIAWYDNFKVTIDGKDIQKLKEIEKPKTKGSNVVFDQLTNQKIKDLELLGRIWGFLKYHHPAIAKGDYNWDYELFEFLPKYLGVNDNDERNRSLLEWINSYGNVKRCKKCPDISPDAYLKPDFKWFNQYGLSIELSDKLIAIQKNRFQGDHHYIDFEPNVGNPKFKNERSYQDIPYPDAGFRLLTLFRFWNMIEYYFPYKHLTDTPWNEVLGKYIEPFIAAKNELEFELITVRLIAEVKDTHANLWGGNNAIEDWKGEYYPPFHIRFREGKAVATDYYEPKFKEISKIAVGDVILEVNGESVDKLVEKRNMYYPASNQPARLRDIGEDLLRSQDSVIRITYQGIGSPQQHKLQLYRKDQVKPYRWYKQERDGKSYHWLKEDIGYITLKNIQAADLELIKSKFLNAKGIIIDIRNYPSYFVPFALGEFFVDRPTPFVKFTIANDKTPGEFFMGEMLYIPPGNRRFKGKLVVLVNELSQSQAEYTAMAFRATPNCTIIGSTTAGADGNVSRISLPGGMSTMISGIGVYCPDGSETQRIGIVPDVEVQPTIKGIRAGRDEILEKAIEIINSF